MPRDYGDTKVKYEFLLFTHVNLRQRSRRLLRDLDIDNNWSEMEKIMYPEYNSQLNNHNAAEIYGPLLFRETVDNHVQKWVHDMMHMWYVKCRSAANPDEEMLFKPDVRADQMGTFLMQSRKISLPSKIDSAFKQLLGAASPTIPEYWKSYFFRPEAMEENKINELIRLKAYPKPIIRVIMQDEEEQTMKDLTNICQMAMQIGVCIAGMRDLKAYSKTEGNILFADLFPAFHEDDSLSADAHSIQNERQYENHLPLLLALCEFYTVTELEQLKEKKPNNSAKVQGAHDKLLDAILQYVRLEKHIEFLEELDYHGLISPISANWQWRASSLNRLLKSAIGFDEYSPIVINGNIDFYATNVLSLLRMHCLFISSMYFWKLVKLKTKKDAEGLLSMICGNLINLVYTYDSSVTVVSSLHMDPSYTSELSMFLWFRTAFDIAAFTLESWTNGWQQTLRGRRFRLLSTGSIMDMMEIYAFCSGNYPVVDTLMQRLLLPYMLTRLNQTEALPTGAESSWVDKGKLVYYGIRVLLSCANLLSAGTYLGRDIKLVSQAHTLTGYTNTNSLASFGSYIVPPQVKWPIEHGMKFTQQMLNDRYRHLNLTDHMPNTKFPMFNSTEQLSVAMHDNYITNPAFQWADFHSFIASGRGVEPQLTLREAADLRSRYYETARDNHEKRKNGFETA